MSLPLTQHRLSSLPPCHFRKILFNKRIAQRNWLHDTRSTDQPMARANVSRRRCRRRLRLLIFPQAASRTEPPFARPHNAVVRCCCRRPSSAFVRSDGDERLGFHFFVPPFQCLLLAERVVARSASFTHSVCPRRPRLSRARSAWPVINSLTDREKRGEEEEGQSSGGTASVARPPPYLPPSLPPPSL